MWGIRLARMNNTGLDVMPSAPGAMGSGHCRAQEPDSWQDILDAAMAYDARLNSFHPLPEELSIRTVASVSPHEDAGGQPAPDLVIFPVESVGDDPRHTPGVLQAALQQPHVSLLLVRRLEMQGLRSIASCVELTRTAERAVEQSCRLVKAYGARLRFLHPHTLSSQDLCLLACGHQRCCADGPSGSDDCCEYHHRHRVEQWLHRTQPAAPAYTLGLRSVSSWDTRGKVAASIRREEADLIVLPVRRSIWLRARRDFRLVRDASRATRGNLLLVR